MNLSAAGQAVAHSSLVTVEAPAAGLAFRLRMPADWVPLPAALGGRDFADPIAVQPVALFHATYGAVVFAVGARPAYDAVAPATWLAAFAAQQPFEVVETGTFRLDRHRAPMCVARRASTVGLVREQIVLLVESGRMFTLSAVAPEGLWPAVRAVFENMFTSFAVVQATAAAGRGVAA